MFNVYSCMNFNNMEESVRKRSGVFLLLEYVRLSQFLLKDPGPERYFKMKKLTFDYNSTNRQCGDEDKTE